MLRPLCFLTLLALIAFAQPAAADTSPHQQMHTVNGVVIEVMPAEKQIKIKHDAVAGYMPGMTMPFDVRDTNELTGLQPGDPVSFRLITTTNDAWIDQIQKTGARTNIVPLTSPFHLARDVEPLNEGDLLPEYHFTNELGQAISTRQYKGQALAMNFLFTRCPYPLYCPLLANNFEATQKQLLSMPNSPTNWHLLTISFDPDFDTPAVLKQYAAAHDANPKRWTFATGSRIDVRAIGEQFGLVFWNEQAGIISHNLRTVVIDASGHVQKIFVGNEWQPADLVAEMVKAAQRR